MGEKTPRFDGFFFRFRSLFWKVEKLAKMTNLDKKMDFASVCIACFLKMLKNSIFSIILVTFFKGTFFENFSKKKLNAELFIFLNGWQWLMVL